MAQEEAPIVPRAASDEEASEIFRRYVAEGLRDPLGNLVECDFGDYAHVLRDPERVFIVAGVEQAVQQPDMIWQLPSPDPLKRAMGVERLTYVKWVREEEGSHPELLVAGCERLPTGQVRLRTWFYADEPRGYLEDLETKGVVLWQSD
jgi:hypothetical protein